MDQDEPPVAPGPEATLTQTLEGTVTQEDLPSKPPSPKPQLSMTLQPELAVDDAGDGLDASLKPLDTSIDEMVDGVKTGDVIEMDISDLGPDGLRLEAAHNLSQMDGEDVLIGGPLMDQSDDPFAESIGK